MTYLALFRPHLNEPGETRYLSAFRVNVVTVLEDQPSHQRSRGAQSPWLTRNSQADQQLQAVAPAQTAGRRVGAGAGATPVFAAVARHDTSLARGGSFVGRSRTCPSSPIANPNTIRSQNEVMSVMSNKLVSKE